MRVVMEMYFPHPRFDPCFAQEHERPPPRHVSSPGRSTAAMFLSDAVVRGNGLRVGEGKWWKHEKETKFVSFLNPTDK